MKYEVYKYSDDKVGRPNMLAERLDPRSIANNGYLREIEEVKFETGINYNDYAFNRVDNLNKPKEGISFTVIGDFNIRKGIFTLIENDKLDINGLYKITSSNHEIVGPVEKVTMDLVRYEL